MAYATVWHWASTRTPFGEHRPADWTTIEDEYEQIDSNWRIANRLVTPVAGQVATGFRQV
ncbi:hypothetical protein [Cohnella massiliensis]|uniref:hypothetical protein n=1 Tax=Cohnella massiliensis TaxID=1816691 RepID=UPI001594225A|nr:hypothetical protein [Cohnella massiliensis]